jgi:hypothetical protein
MRIDHIDRPMTIDSAHQGSPEATTFFGRRDWPLAAWEPREQGIVRIFNPSCGSAS